MTPMQFTDAAPLSGVRRNADGYLTANAYAVRTGVQDYAGREVGKPDMAIVRVYRPEAEVRDVKSMATFTHATVTLGHPSEMVTSDNWSALAKGEVSTEAEWKDGKIRLPLIVKDAAAIAAIEGGIRELSAGYTCDLEFGAGTSPEGEAYDATQRNIRINHLAIVPKGRAGSECRIGDAVVWGVPPLSSTADMKGSHMADNLHTVVLGDEAAQVAVADAPKVEAFKTSMLKKLADADAALTAAEKKAKEDADEAERKMAKKDAEIAALQKDALTDAALDARVAARADLLAKATLIAKDVATAGLSDAAIRKAAVVAALGDAAIAGKGDAYIDARFDILAEDAANADPVAKALKDGTSQKMTDLDTLYDGESDRLSKGWMQTEKKGA